jgi:WD40 repeat protein/DNA-binding SARP family transcriptional activator
VDNALRIYTLGGLSIECNDQPVSGFVSRKVEALLVYLACTRRPQAREVLAELLWPERTQSQSLGSLRGGLSNLRQVLPANVNVTRRTVTLASDPACWVDVAEVEQLLARAGIRDRRESILSDAEAKALVGALDLYQGDFLQGFYVADSRAFEEWAELERDRLRRIVIEALHHLVLYDLQHGVYADGIAQATRLLSLDPLHEEINRHLILLLAQAGQRTQALAQYEAYCRLLDEELGVKPSSDLVALYRQIQSGAASRPAAPQIQPRVAVLANPYKGLHPFQETDAADFFGREASVQRLLARLKADGVPTRFLAVVGPSGSGKSSLVRAGLIPALRKGALPGSDRWPIVTMLPGSHPLEELTMALRRLAMNPDPVLWRDLDHDKRGLLRIIKHLLPDDAHVELFLLIDQFEEIFSLVSDENVRRHFLDSLLTALVEPHSRLRVVVTLRADFYDRPLLYADLGEMVRQGTEVVLPLSPEELQRAVVGPVERLGVQVEPAVVAQIVTDVNHQPGALPMLQYALTELFEHREDNRLTLAAYQVAGGVRGTLAARAESLYAALDEKTQRIARQVFLRLVHLGEGTEDTRRRVPWAEIVSVADSEASAQSLVNRFVEHRLLTLDHDPETGSSTVELAHEALIREWQRFHTWIDESRADLRQQHILATSKAEWTQAEQDRSYLLSGSRLAQFEDWAATTDVALTPEERQYLDASIAEHQRQRARRRRVRNAAFATVALVAVIMTALSLVAFNQRSTARRQRDKAEREAAVNYSLVLANDAQDAFGSGETDLGLALALEAVRMNQPPPEAERTLRDVAFGPGTRAILEGHSNGVRTVAFNAHATLALSGSCAVLDAGGDCQEGELIVWDVETATELRRLVGHTGWVNRVAFTPDRQAHPVTALSASGDLTLILWNVETGEPIRVLEGHLGGVNSVVYTPDGHSALSGSDDHTLILWDLETGEVIRRFEGHSGAVTSVAISPDSKTALSGSDDHTMILWDLETGEVLRRFEGQDESITRAAFRPNSQTVLSAVGRDLREQSLETGEEIKHTPDFYLINDFAVSADGRVAVYAANNKVSLYDFDSGQKTKDLVDHPGDVWTVAIDADARLVLSGAADGSLRLWNIGSESALRRFHADNALVTVAVSPGGERVLTGEFGGIARLWNVGTGEVLHLFEGNAPAVVAVDFSPDGRYALAGAGDFYGETGARSLILWDVETGEEVRRFEGYEYPVRSAAFSPDGRTILGGSQQYSAAAKGAGELFLWDVATGQLIRRFENTGDVTGIAFNSDGSLALTSSALNKNFTLWEVATGQPIRRLDYASRLFDIAFGPDEKTALAASEDTDLILVDLATGDVIRRYKGHNSLVFSLDLSPDGQSVISGEYLGDVILWDFETGQELHRFVSDPSTKGVAFSPDGQTVFGASYSGTLYQWQVADWPLDKLLAWVHENRYIRDFTCEERAQYRIEPLCE